VAEDVMPFHPYIYINPEDASQEGRPERDAVELFKSLGKIVMKAKFGTSLPLRVLWASSHALGLNSERISLVMNDNLERLDRGLVFNSSKVRIKLVREE